MFKMFNRRVHLLTYSVLTELLGAKFRKRFLLVCCFFFFLSTIEGNVMPRMYLEPYFVQVIRD